MANLSTQKKTLQRKVCERVVCFTTVKAKEIIKEPRFQNPKQILLLVGTNDPMVIVSTQYVK